VAVYKVIQDVEAEDKIVGPLSLKQLIFAGIAFGAIFIAFRIVVATGVIYVAIPFLPIIFIFGFLAAPIGRDQPTEMWLAAQIRFFTKPRVRIWDQSDIKHLVNITVPKHEEKVYTDGLNQTQVHSRLKALASTLDSRGWAVKNVDINMYGTAAYGQAVSDRLIDPSSLPAAVPAIDVKASDDIMDVSSNETAHHFDELMQASSKAHKDAVIAKMHQKAEKKESQQKPAEDYWFMHQPQAPAGDPGGVMFGQNIVQPATTSDDDANITFLNDDDDEGKKLSDEEQKIIERAKRQKEQAQSNYSAHHKVVLTPAQQTALEAKQKQEKIEQERAAAEKQAEEQRKKAQEEKTHLTKADTIELANANLKVSTIAGLAKHKSEEKQDPNEVVVKLR
jgi:hypothetical protein